MSPDTIQLIAFFTTGYLISRLIIKAELPEHIVHFLIGRYPVTLHRILLYLIGLSVFLSFLIPNTLTVLTLLPLLLLLRDRILSRVDADATVRRRVTTMLALAAIYGSNIGGMGSITATAANGILVGFAMFNDVPGIEKLTFATWLVWGIPLVITFTVLAWSVMVIAFRPAKLIRVPIHIEEAAPDRGSFYAPAIVLSIGFFVGAFVLSLLLNLFPDYANWIVALTLVSSVALITGLFVYRVPYFGGTSPLLTIPDCYSNLPGRGLVFVGIAFGLAALLGLTGLHHLLAGFLTDVFPPDLSLLAILVILAALTSFATELFSNTVIQLAMFTVILPLASFAEFNPLVGLMLVTLSSTCAFMSPFATGVNSLAFGEIRGTSLRRMLVLGLVMNVLGALLISGWLLWIVAPFYDFL